MNYKGMLQELCQTSSDFAALPSYLCRSEGAPHAPTFWATVTIEYRDDSIKYIASGDKKMEAMQNAAKLAYDAVSPGNTTTRRKRIEPSSSQTDMCKLMGSVDLRHKVPSTIKGLSPDCSSAYIFFVDQENRPSFVKRWCGVYRNSTFNVFASKGASAIKTLPTPLPANVTLTLSPPGYSNSADIELTIAVGESLHLTEPLLHTYVLVSSDKFIYVVEAILTRKAYFCMVV